MPKSRDAFRTISEVAEWLDTQAHVLRFWESKFTQVKPVKRAGGRRYYRPSDMKLLGGIKHLLHDEGMTIKGAQKLLRDKGVRHVASLSQPLVGEAPAPLGTDAVDAPSPPETPVIDATPDTPDVPESTPLVAPAPDPEPVTAAEAAVQADDRLEDGILGDEPVPNGDEDTSQDSTDTDEDADTDLPDPESLPAFLQRATFPDSAEDQELAEAPDTETGADEVSQEATPIVDDTPPPPASPHPRQPEDAAQPGCDALVAALLATRRIAPENRDAALAALERLQALNTRLKETEET